MRLLFLAGVLAASTALAGCGSDSSAPPSSSPPSAPPTTAPAASSSSSEAVTKGVDTAAPTAAAPSRGPQQCAQQRDITLKIVLGDLDCATAYGVAFKVNRDGEKRQDVDTYVCEFGNATIRPTIFSCTDRANGTEFSVDET